MQDTQILQEMGLQHSSIAIALLALATELGDQYEIDTNSHDAIWVTNLKTGEQIILRAFQVEQS